MKHIPSLLSCRIAAPGIWWLLPVSRLVLVLFVLVMFLLFPEFAIAGDTAGG